MSFFLQISYPISIYINLWAPLFMVPLIFETHPNISYSDQYKISDAFISQIWIENQCMMCCYCLGWRKYFWRGKNGHSHNGKVHGLDQIKPTIQACSTNRTSLKGFKLHQQLWSFLLICEILRHLSLWDLQNHCLNISLCTCGYTQTQAYFKHLVLKPFFCRTPAY